MPGAESATTHRCVDILVIGEFGETMKHATDAALAEKCCRRSAVAPAINECAQSVCGRMQSCACRRLANVRILYIFRASLICLSPAATQVHRCLNGRAPPYLSEHCIPISSADTRRHLRSANRHLLAVPRFRLNTYGRRAFSVAGPMSWNSLPDFIRDPTSSTDCFRRLLKTYLLARY